MSPRPVGSGRPGTMVLPASVSQSAQAVEDLARPDQCIIRDPAPGRVYEQGLGKWADTAAPVVYAGECRAEPIKVRNVRQTEYGDQQITETRYAISLPIATTGIKVGQVVTMTASNDPNLIGRTLRVIEFVTSTTQTALRLTCETVEP